MPKETPLLIKQACNKNSPVVFNVLLLHAIDIYLEKYSVHSQSISGSVEPDLQH
jgi:hypothetical protein